MSEVSMMDSSALGVLAIVYKDCKRQREFALCHISKNIQTLLRMTRMDQVLPCFETQDEALVELKKSVPVEQGTGS